MKTPRSRLLLVATLVLVVLAGLLYARTIVNDTPLPALSVHVSPEHLPADGESTVIVSVDEGGESRPSVRVEGEGHGVLEGMERTASGWRVRIRAGVLPGSVALHIELPGYQPRTIQFTAEPYNHDAAGDGTPDALRLDDNADQQAFRKWFTWLAEAQYFEPPEARPAEITDCAALIRFAYRGALRKHDSEWANSSGLPQLPTFDSPEKYRYPFTPLGAALFRVQPGPYLAGDGASGAFLQFADAQTLWRFNTHFVSRDVSRARPGDLLFFRRQSSPVTFHGMIYLGESTIRPDGHRYLVYHTGPSGAGAHTGPGEIRRPTVEELMRFPQPEWRPEPSNPAFLGVMRWNILRRLANETDANPR